MRKSVMGGKGRCLVTQRRVIPYNDPIDIIGRYNRVDSSPYGIPRGNQIEDRLVYLVY